MSRLVETPAEALQAIEAFQWEAEEITDRLSHVRAWYAHQGEDGTWLFGPSKFIGYYEMTSDIFLAPKNGLDGRKTEDRLQEWFEEVPKDSKLGRVLHNRLSTYLDTLGKAPSKVARINVLSEPVEEDQSELEAKVIDLIAAVTKLLPSVRRAELRRKIG